MGSPPGRGKVTPCLSDCYLRALAGPFTAGGLRGRGAPRSCPESRERLRCFPAGARCPDLPPTLPAARRPASQRTTHTGREAASSPPPQGRGLSTQLILLRPERAQGRPRSRLWFCCSDRKGKRAITPARSRNVSSLWSEGHSHVIVKGKQHTGIVFKGKQITISNLSVTVMHLVFF